MGDYFKHWLSFEKPGVKIPPIFGVNWFRRDKENKFMWPGYSENMRVLKWIFQRCQGVAGGFKHALGTSPRFEDMDWAGHENYSKVSFAELHKIDGAAWTAELEAQREFLARFGEHLPVQLMGYHEQLKHKLMDGADTAATTGPVNEL
jgi:phosphoenolpyruvate carboxykinase (GTP)